jgi:hypothetical protein
VLLVGSPSSLAIESSISRVTDHSLGLGYFVVHLGGRQFGVRREDATLLGNSYDEVVSHIARRGRHTFPRELQSSAVELAVGYLRGEFLEVATNDDRRLAGALHGAGVVWSGGDEAFDDGSLLLLFDRRETVRIIGIVNSGDITEMRRSVAEVEMSGDEFYGTLDRWSQRFMQEVERLNGVSQ